MIETDYRINEDGNSLQVVRNGAVVATTINEIFFALEAIFVLEGSNRDDWYIERDGVVFRTKREHDM